MAFEAAESEEAQRRPLVLGYGLVVSCLCLTVTVWRLTAPKTANVASGQVREPRAFLAFILPSYLLRP